MTYKLDPDNDPLYQRLLPIYHALDEHTKRKVYTSFQWLWEGGINKDKPGYFTAGEAMKRCLIGHGIDVNTGYMDKDGSAEYEEAIKAQDIYQEVTHVG
jgi:hypothetical protein